MKTSQVKLVIVSVLILISILFALKLSLKENGCCNVIIISITNLAANHMSLYGYQRDTTPNIDNFAKGSLVFENTFTHSSLTLPSGASLFTSLYPLQHNVTNRYSGEFLSNNIQTLPDILNKNDYVTAAFTGGFDYDLRYNVLSRFSDSKVFTNVETRVFGYGGLNQTTEASLNWLKENSNKKFLLFVQGYDVHCPFTPDESFDNAYDTNYTGNLDHSPCYMTFEDTQPFYENNKSFFPVKAIYSNETKDVNLSEDDVKHLVALYDDEIKQTDSLIGNFLVKLEGMGVFKNTIIIVTSEHGDMLGKHGRFMRGGPIRGTFFDDVLKVPLIIKHPDLGHKEISGLVQLIDVAPTIMEFVGLKSYDTFEGKSLLPLITKNESVNELVFSGSSFTPPKDSTFFNKSTTVVTVRNLEWKLIKEIVYEPDMKSIESVNNYLYNLKDDPEELNDVFGNHQNIARSLNNEIKKRFDV